MTDMLEKAARAAWASYPNDDASFYGLTADQKDTAYKQARAVLLAIREPSEEILAVKTPLGPMHRYGQWQAMIDAILAQPSEGEG